MQGGFEIQLMDSGVLQLRVFHPETSSSRLVSVYRDPETAFVSVLVGRLLYREELIHRLRLPRNDSRNDAELAGLVYRKLGREALVTLEGEFACCLIECNQKRVIAIRDILGSYPLYHSTVGELRVGTSLRSLGQTAEINQEYLAALLASPFAFVELPEPQTAYRRINRVLAGEILEISANSKATIGTFGWQAETHSGDMTFPDAVEGFRHRLNLSVQERMKDQTTGVHLSGGMDSSSIACLARNHGTQNGDRIS
ncbi:MAG: hypothetical protein KDA84_09255, partial [Planctomycetaceae bacterium]|nr:hypothetical protein [Planctomycetaceae bacterium]